MGRLKQFILGNREPDYSNRLNPQLSLAIRVIVGGYVIYSAYSIRGSVKTAETPLKAGILLAFIIFFYVAGFLLCYSSGRDYLIGRYQGGKLDMGEKPEETENTEDVENTID